MEVLIEFQGISRVITKSKKLPLDIKPDTTYRQIIQRLAVLYPGLVGEVIAKDQQTMLGSNMVSLNGKNMLRPSDLENTPVDGDKLTIMSILAGG
jgi:molybdopterin converting factor small subunit